MSLLTPVNDLDFEPRVLQSSLPFLMVVSAPWCGPCRVLKPLLEAAAASYEQRLTIGELDMDTSPLTAGRNRVQGAPTLLLFHQGEEISRHLGLMSRARLSAWIDRGLALGLESTPKPRAVAP